MKEILQEYINTLRENESLEEMISISRKQVQKLYSEALKSVPTCEHDRGYRIAELITLKNLFGSKCLPEEPLSQNSTKICDNKNLTLKSEPRFKLWDLVVYDGEVHKIVGILPYAQYHLSGHEYAVDESRLQPYTEPTQTNNNMEDKEHRNLSQDSANCDKAEDKYYCDNKMCCRNGEGYLPPLYCDKVLCNRRESKPKKWRAEKGGVYYFLSGSFKIVYTTDDYYPADDRLYKCGNYFSTKELAQQASEAVKKCLEDFHQSSR